MTQPDWQEWSKIHFSKGNKAVGDEQSKIFGGEKDKWINSSFWDPTINKGGNTWWSRFKIKDLRSLRLIADGFDLKYCFISFSFWSLEFSQTLSASAAIVVSQVVIFSLMLLPFGNNQWFNLERIEKTVMEAISDYATTV